MRMTAAPANASARSLRVPAIVRIAQWSACAAAALHLGLAPAQAPAPTADIVYRVVAGDTLYDLATTR